jgi:hypothetical protein
MHTNQAPRHNIPDTR